MTVQGICFSVRCVINFPPTLRVSIPALSALLCLTFSGGISLLSAPELVDTYWVSYALSFFYKLLKYSTESNTRKYFLLIVICTILHHFPILGYLWSCSYAIAIDLRSCLMVLSRSTPLLLVFWITHLMSMLINTSSACLAEAWFSNATQWPYHLGLYLLLLISVIDEPLNRGRLLIFSEDIWSYYKLSLKTCQSGH